MSSVENWRPRSGHQKHRVGQRVHAKADFHSKAGRMVVEKMALVLDASSSRRRNRRSHRRLGGGVRNSLSIANFKKLTTMAPTTRVMTHVYVEVVGSS